MSNYFPVVRFCFRFASSAAKIARQEDGRIMSWRRHHWICRAIRGARPLPHSSHVSYSLRHRLTQIFTDKPNVPCLRRNFLGRKIVPEGLSVTAVYEHLPGTAFCNRDGRSGDRLPCFLLRHLHRRFICTEQTRAKMIPGEVFHHAGAGGCAHSFHDFRILVEVL